MKKKILSIMIVAALALSMTACGAASDETTAEGNVTTTVSTAEKADEEKEESKAEEDSAEATTTAAETEETTTTTEAPKDVKKITSIQMIYNDGMYFKADDVTYVYNIADNKMYEYESESNIYEYGGIKGKIARNNNGLYNLETKEQYDVTPFFVSASDYNPVYKIETSSNGDTYSFGIIDKNGNWVLPLSSEYAICDFKPEKVYGTSSSLSVFKDKNTTMVYDYKNDKIITASELGEESVYNVLNDYIITGRFNASSYGYENFTVHNVNTGESKSIIDTHTPVGSGPIISDGFFVWYNEDSMTVFGEDFEKLHEITGYDYPSYKCATENYIMFSPAGNNDIIILDKDGNKVVEPFSFVGNYGIIGDYAVNISWSGSDSIINCATGEMVDCKYDADYYRGGKLIVLSDDTFYLVDPAAPDTLINPFE